jgi:outer membrane protein assembly factor BamB
MTVLAQYVYHLDAKVAGSSVSGTVAATFQGQGGQQTVKGGITGTLQSETQLAENQRLPPGKDWPWYFGVGAALEGPHSDAVMIDDLARARPVWKSEDLMPTCWGNAPDGRYAIRAAYTRTTGGASSPVVADGRVYQFYYRPTGDLPPQTMKQIEGEAAKVSGIPNATAYMADFLRPRADDVVVCLEAATGKTLWKTTYPDASANHQTHKWRGFNPTPCVAGDTVYVLDYANCLHALEASTGKPKWDCTALASKIFTASGTGPVVTGRVVAFPAGNAVLGLETGTGKPLWTQAEAGGTLLPWTSGGKTRLLAVRHGVRPSQTDAKKKEAVTQVACLDPATGKPLWTGDTEFRAVEYLPVLSGDYLVSYASLIENNVSNSGRVLAYRLTAEGLQRAWESAAPAPVTDSFGLAIANGVVYVDGEKLTFALRLSDGQKLAAVEGVGGARTQLAFFANGRLLIQPEGRHGRQAFYMLDGSPAAFRQLGALWDPPHPWTTAYADMPIGYPLVDGRLFVRGFDGIYCYDLRK